MMVTVPDVTGVTENDATFLLGEAHLDAATALDYCGTQPLAGLCVHRCRPQALKVPAGTEVTIYIARDYANTPGG